MELQRLIASLGILAFAALAAHEGYVRVSANEQLGSHRPEHLNMTWQHDPKTTQSFTWRTSTAFRDSVLEIVKSSDFNGSFGGNSKRIEGKSFLFSTDLGDMQVHEAEAVQLEPGTSYKYRVGDGSADGWSGVVSFKTEAPANDPFTFLFTSDSQAVPNGSSTNGYGIWGEIFMKALQHHPDARFMLLSGDIVDHGDEQIHWENWFKAAEAYLPKINMVPTIGNHDVLKDGERYFRAQFQLPGNGPAGEVEHAYSFDYGNMHMAVLNTEGDLQKQAAWLKEDMKKSDQQWKIVSFHRSPYHSHETRSSLDVRDAWTPVFDAAGVDLVLSGHDHAYMRSWPLYDGKKVNDGEGTTYVIGGTAGPKFYDMGNFPWMRVKFDENIQIYAGVHIDHGKLTFRVTTRDGRTVDAFSIVKPDGPFIDVPSTHWAFPVINTLFEKHIVSGVGNGRYAPNRPVTRAEFAALLVRSLGLPAAGGSEFGDVAKDSWYAGGISAAYKAGIVSGVGPRVFAPDRQITREEMATLLMNAYRYKTGSVPPPAAASSFKDMNEVSDWAKSSVLSAASLGFVNGRKPQMFVPNGKTTRAESATGVYHLQ